jgi:hypothetical protein
MLEMYAVILFAACVLALVDWRIGIYAAVFIDLIRDPFRKLIDDQPVAVTVSGCAVWGIVLIRVMISEQNELKRLWRAYSGFRMAILCLTMAIVPAAMLSLVLYRNGYLLAAIGLASYVTPLFGIAAGFAFARRPDDIPRLFRFYAVVNAIALISVPIEYLGIPSPVLGGIKHDWIRYFGAETIKLISGIYRSPDIMGLHAAHVFIFSLMLASQSRVLGRASWGAIAIWALVCLVLCGRRKMIGMPLVFVSGYVVLLALRKISPLGRVLTWLLPLGMLGGAAYFLLDPDLEASQHAEYATSIFTESPERLNTFVFGSVVSTLQQHGMLGAGIGTATQGRHFVNVTSGSVNGWQEDGVSKLLLEFGVPGMFFLMLGGFGILAATSDSMRWVPRSARFARIQLALGACLAANAASFVISHQQYSGDPVSSLMVLLMLGMVLSFPRFQAHLASPVSGPREPVHEPLTPVMA